MPQIDLFLYQQKAVDALAKETYTMLQNTAALNKRIVLKAPTGAGKTVMAAAYIVELLSNKPQMPRDFTFLWISTGQAKLHEQSKDSLDRYCEQNTVVDLYENTCMSGSSTLPVWSVTVVNWEKLRNPENKARKNVADYYNLEEVLANTRETCDIILLIDESHLGNDAKRTKEVRNIINAALTVEISATPKGKIEGDLFDDTPRTDVGIQIQMEDVIAEGMIKKEVLINPNIDKFNDENDDTVSQNIILEAAFAQREALEQAYRALGRPIKPLVMLQLPNSDAGDVLRKAIELFLITKGKTYENGTVAIGLTGESSPEIARIAKPESKIEFLIFKTAFGTGWDCPRADILVMFRKIGSPDFTIQTVGRILRMPEQQHYSDETLNVGYVYTNIFPIKIGAAQYENKIIKHLTSFRNKEIIPITLYSYYQRRTDFGTIKAAFERDFTDVWCNHFGIDEHAAVPNSIENRAKMQAQGFNLALVRNSEILGKDGSIAAKHYDNAVAAEAGLHKMSAEQSRKSDGLMEVEFMNFLRGICGSKGYAVRDSGDAVANSLGRWIRTYIFPNKETAKILYLHNIILREPNIGIAKQLILTAIEQYEPKRLAAVGAKNRDEWEDITLPPSSDLFSSETHTEINAPLNALQPYFRENRPSKIEIAFEAYLESKTDKIAWWYRNGEVVKKTYFGIQHFEDKVSATFYPDYIIQLKNGETWIIDTKEGDTAKKATSRAEALQVWLTTEHEKGNKNLRGGIVILSSDVFRINTNDTYRYNEKDLREWKFLNEMF